MLVWLSGYYLQIKSIHIALALGSGSLFLLRMALCYMPFLRNMSLRFFNYFSYLQDTFLLLSATLLLVILRLNPLTTSWLAVKLLLLLGYIIAGSFALKRAKSVRGRSISFVLAVLCFAAIYKIARTHHPLGWMMW